MTKADPLVYVQEACFWIKGHPEEFKRLMRLMHREVNRGNPSIQRGDVYKLAREAGFRVSEIDKLKRDNNIYAPLARYMVMLRPRLAKSIRFREAGADGVDMVAEWHSIVNAGTTFLANSRKEAQKLVELDDARAA